MAVPNFQSLMLPLLRLAADESEHSLAEARDALAAEFHLSTADLEEPLPSGRQPKFSNRVAWAKSDLQQAGLLVSPRRGHFRLSARGRDVLRASPSGQRRRRPEAEDRDYLNKMTIEQKHAALCTERRVTQARPSG